MVPKRKWHFVGKNKEKLPFLLEIKAICSHCCCQNKEVSTPSFRLCLHWIASYCPWQTQQLMYFVRVFSTLAGFSIHFSHESPVLLIKSIESYSLSDSLSMLSVSPRNCVLLGLRTYLLLISNLHSLLRWGIHWVSLQMANVFFIIKFSYS